jgi:hypothetical protein
LPKETICNQSSEGPSWRNDGGGEVLSSMLVAGKSAINTLGFCNEEAKIL